MSSSPEFVLPSRRSLFNREKPRECANRIVISSFLPPLSTVVRIRHVLRTCATSSLGTGYSIRDWRFPQFAARQESAMRPQKRSATPLFLRIPAVSAPPRSLLAAILSFACILSLTVELPASAAIPAAAKDKKTQNDNAT